MKRAVAFTASGVAQRIEVEPMRRSIDVLREDLGLTGPKEEWSCGGFQMRYCTPGQIVGAYAPLSERPQPTDEQIEEGVLGNLCHCTGYYKIVESIKTAAAEMLS